MDVGSLRWPSVQGLDSRIADRQAVGVTAGLSATGVDLASGSESCVHQRLPVVLARASNSAAAARKA